MRVKVRTINVNGVPEERRIRARRELYVGDLRVFQLYQRKLGRSVITAQIVNPADNLAAPMLELHDVALLFVKEDKMRLRGFELTKSAQHAQTWDVEIG